MAALDAYMELKGLLDGAVYMDEPLARHTTYHIGGLAALYVECATVHDLTVCFEVLRRHQLPWAIIGKGSNLLIANTGYRGAIITLTGHFREINLPQLEHGEGSTGGAQPSGNYGARPQSAPQAPSSLTAGAAVILGNVVQAAFRSGFSGFEFAVGIPGTLGGALAMNAGTATEWIGAIVNSLVVYRPGTGLVRIASLELPWGYRTSGLPAEDIIVEAELAVVPGHTGQIRARMEGSLNRRRAVQPLNKPSAGSVFRNPEGNSAGKLIEDVGLKGYTVGGAQVSELHANFIVNNGSATAADVLAIIMECRRRVKEAYGIKLQTEIRFLGFEDE